jgi:hypothetical protein
MNETEHNNTNNTNNRNTFVDILLSRINELEHQLKDLRNSADTRHIIPEMKTSNERNETKDFIPKSKTIPEVMVNIRG